MNILKKIIRSIMPLWIELMYSTREENVHISKAAKFLILFLPAACAYIISNYNSEDKRRIKYWLPYGPLKMYQLKNHGVIVDEKKHSHIASVIRWILPYGYVLWWDSERSIVVKGVQQKAKDCNLTVESERLARLEKKLDQLIKDSAETQKNQKECMEQTEVQLLRLAVELKNYNT